MEGISELSPPPLPSLRAFDKCFITGAVKTAPRAMKHKNGDPSIWMQRPLEFSGGSMVKTPRFACGQPSSISDQGIKTPHVTWSCRKTKRTKRTFPDTVRLPWKTTSLPASLPGPSRKLEAMAFLLLCTLPPRHRMDHTSPVPAGVLGAALNHTAFLRREHRRGRGHRSLGSGPRRTSPSTIKPPRVLGDARWKRLAAQRLWE